MHKTKISSNWSQYSVRGKFNFDTEYNKMLLILGRVGSGLGEITIKRAENKQKSAHPLIFVIHNNYVLQANILLGGFVVINVASDRDIILL